MAHARDPSSPAAPITWAEYIQLPDDDRRELIDGVLVDPDDPWMKPDDPPWLHPWAVGEILLALKLWARAHGGVVMPWGHPVPAPDGRRLVPDVQLVRQPSCVRSGDGPTDLAVEVISPVSGRRDRVTKFNGYAAIGVAEYWLVDPQARLLERFVLDGEHYRLAARLADDARFEPESFPGLSIPLATLWTLPPDPTDKRDSSNG